MDQEKKLDYKNNFVSDISSQIKAFVGWPVAEAKVLGEKIKIWEAICILDEHQKKPGQVISFTNSGLIIAAGTGSVKIKKLLGLARDK